jgi:predicted DNA-binding ribbon-helix-helix protein
MKRKRLLKARGFESGPSGLVRTRRASQSRRSFGKGLNEMARERDLPLSNLLGDINKKRAHANLSSVILLVVLDHYRPLAAERTQRREEKRL